MSQPSIAFWCGKSLEPWAPPSLTAGGIGGSETAVIYIAALFAKAGWKVDVWTGCDYYEGVYDSVLYADPKRMPADASYDVLVSWRNPEAWQVPARARVKALWMHDHHAGDVAAHMHQFDRVVGVSQTHADFLAECYELPPSKVGYVPNGIDLARFDTSIKKVPFRCVWSSSPDRDLDLMLKLWPRIVQVEPAAELHVAYGWQGLDYRIGQGDQAAQVLKDRLLRAFDRLPSAHWLDRIGQDKLAELKCSAWMSPYPSAFFEVSMISAMESMAAGAVPVMCETGAIKETVGDGGYIVPGNPYSPVTQDMFVRVCHAVLGEANARVSKMRVGYERAKLFTWQKAFEDHWLPKVAGLLEGVQEEVPV